MAVISAVRTALCVAICCGTPVFLLGAPGSRPRVPAEIEMRRAEIAERLSAIAVEAEALAMSCETPTIADHTREEAPRAPVLERETCEVMRRTLADEKTKLEEEQASLAVVRTRSATGPIQRGDAQGLNPLDLSGQSGQVTSGPAFNPAFAVIPDIAYYNDSRQGDGFARLAAAVGFAEPADDAGAPDAHGHSSLDRGFNLREVELAFSGAVDPYFDVWVTLAVSAEGLDTEEAYVQTRRFLPGWQMRVGKFFSGIGHVNRQHPHQWDFADQALPYDALLGGNLDEIGLQVTWLPDLPLYALLGFEALQGDSAHVSRQLAAGYPGVFEDTAGPRLFTGFAKISPEIGYSDALQGGLSFGRSRSHQEARGTAGVLEEALDGTAWFAGTDWIWRHDSPRPAGHGDLTMQGEYLYRRKDLAAVDLDTFVPAAASRLISSQDGAYGQVVYGIAPRWTMAARIDVIGLTNVTRTLDGTTHGGSVRRFSSALTFNPTEFSRLRVQYDAGATSGAQQTTVHQVFVQFQMSLGAHGAHKF